MFPEPRHRFIETIVPVAHYTFDQLLGDLQSGHNIIGTVFYGVQCVLSLGRERGDEGRR